MATPMLLGYLARFGSFSAQSEVLCTQGLTYLLRTHEDARAALADTVELLTGLAIGDSLTWLAEATHEDRARPDLEARTADGVPVVNIEAKIGAELHESQLQSYVAHLQKHNARESALLVLVPKGRTSEATQVTSDALCLAGAGPWRVTDGHRTGVAVMSWCELFDALQSGNAEQFRHELEQLQAMYRVLSGDYIAPLASIEELRRWQDREADFLNLVDQVTRRLTTRHRLYPMGFESWDDSAPESESRGYRRRYVSPVDGDMRPFYCIGVRDSFAEWVTPVWMRFHKDTVDFERIRQRIDASELRSLESGGHIWIPLTVPINAPSEQMIEKLFEQAKAVERVAFAAQ